MQRRLRHALVLLIAAALGGLAVHAGRALYASRKDGLPLAVRWEGAVIDHNFRDVGASLNACLGRRMFAEGVLMRSNVWFSGWSCDDVGNPDVIYSLNYAPERHELYFCRNDTGNLVGRHFNDIMLNDLEFIENWDKPEIEKGTCGFIVDELTSIAEGRRVLVHCDAGQDRTGTFSALMGAMASESQGQLNATMLEALECDYRRTRKLDPKKFGRMQTFITQLQARGGVARFLIDRCKLDPSLISAASARLLAP